MSEQIDDNYVNGVYVKADGTEQVEISPQYVYMTVPSKYVCVYHKLLVLMAQYGLDMLNDCSATCKGNNKKYCYLLEYVSICYGGISTWSRQTC